MRGFEDIGSKGHFSAKKGIFGPKPPWGANDNFFKNPLGTFFSLAKMQLCAKFQKNLMRGSPDIASRTDARTHGRTNERESIGPSANANGQNVQNKNFPRHNTAIWWLKAIVPSFWPSFRQIWCVDSKKMSKNLIFCLKMAKIGKNWPNGIFFQKSAWNIFLDSSRCSFVQKINKIWCAVF